MEAKKINEILLQRRWKLLSAIRCHLIEDPLPYGSLEMQNNQLRSEISEIIQILRWERERFSKDSKNLDM